MSREAATGAHQRSPSARRALPVVAVDSREDMAVMLAMHGRLLRDYARHYLGEVDDNVIEDAVERTVAWLLRIEQPSFPHGLRYATKALWRECQRAERRSRLEAIPVDRLLGPLTGALARAVDRLGPRSREVFIEAAKGRSSAEIAKMQNTTAEAIRIRLHHARRRAKQLMKEGHLTASGFWLAIKNEAHRPSRRLLAWRHRRLPAPGWPKADPLTQLAAATAAAVLVAGVASDALGRPGPAPVAAATLSDPIAPVVSPPVGGQREVAVLARSPHPTNASAMGSASPADDRPGLTLPLSTHVAGSEVPEDAQLETATAPADYTATHTIVALGLGQACACQVLFESTDGGASWTAASSPVPAGAEQLALPPTYPADSRIFIGTNAQTGTSTFVVDRFGDVATPLAGPAGHVALAAAFDHGDDSVFVAGQAEVASIAVDATPSAATPMLLYPTWFGYPASLATPVMSEAVSVTVLAPPGTVAVGDLAAGQTSARQIFACTVGARCAVRGTPPPQSLLLATAPSDSVSTASWGQGIAVSRDGASTFSEPSIPAGTSVLSVAPADGRVWAIMHRGAGSLVLWSSPAGDAWADVTGADQALPRSLAIIALPGGTVLTLLSGKGLRCSADGGVTWASRCP